MRCFLCTVPLFADVSRTPLRVILYLKRDSPGSFFPFYLYSALFYFTSTYSVCVFSGWFFSVVQRFGTIAAMICYLLHNQWLSMHDTETCCSILLVHSYKRYLKYSHIISGHLSFTISSGTSQPSWRLSVSFICWSCVRLVFCWSCVRLAVCQMSAVADVWFTWQWVTGDTWKRSSSCDRIKKWIITLNRFWCVNFSDTKVKKLGWFYNQNKEWSLGTVTAVSLP